MTSKVSRKVIVSGGILKSGTTIRECDTEKKSNRYIKRKNYKETI